jgi:hypothetical protein
MRTRCRFAFSAATAKLPATAAHRITRGRRRSISGAHAFAALIACCIGLWAWTAGLNGPYHFDDQLTPLSDPASQSFSAWRRNLSVTLRPTTKLSYALEAETGLSHRPAPRRVVSLFLHLLSAGLLYVLITQQSPI